MIWAIIIAAVLIVLFFALLFCIASIISIRRKERDAVAPDICPGTIWEDKAPAIREAAKHVNAMPHEDVFIRSFDGLRLHGRLIPPEQSPRGAIILMHGYRSMAKNDFSLIVEFYRNLGLYVLMADQRAHSGSEGRRITFGVRESRDAVEWANYLGKRLGYDFPVISSGLSMGASTVLMGAGIGYPKNVCGIIADCGFSTPYDIVRSVAAKKHLPLGITMALSSMAVRIFAGFGLKEASTVRAMSTNHIPVLFIHGTGDNFVPYEMTVQAYNACKAPCRLILVDGAGHGDSYLKDKNRCERELHDFIYSVVSSS